MATTLHYLIKDEIMIICNKNAYTYKTLHVAKSLTDVWTKEIKIIDPYACHEMSVRPENWEWEIDEENSDTIPAPGYRYSKYKAFFKSSKNDLVDHVVSYDEYASKVRVFRTVFELKEGELPILGHTVRDRYVQ